MMGCFPDTLLGWMSQPSIIESTHYIVNSDRNGASYSLDEHEHNASDSLRQPPPISFVPCVLYRDGFERLLAQVLLEIITQQWRASPWRLERPSLWYIFLAPYELLFQRRNLLWWSTDMDYSLIDTRPRIAFFSSRWLFSESTSIFYGMLKAEFLAQATQIIVAACQGCSVGCNARRREGMNTPCHPLTSHTSEPISGRCRITHHVWHESLWYGECTINEELFTEYCKKMWQSTHVAAKPTTDDPIWKDKSLFVDILCGWCDVYIFGVAAAAKGIKLQQMWNLKETRKSWFGEWKV